jgi:hypothetical protein
LIKASTPLTIISTAISNMTAIAGMVQPGTHTFDFSK